MKLTEAYAIFKRYFNGELSPKDQNLVRLWLTLDVNREEKDATLKQLWQEDAFARSEDKVEAAWKELSDSIDSVEEAKQRRISLRRVLRYAAAVLLPIVTAVAAWVGSSAYYASQANMLECAVSDGMSRTIYLSDNTKVQLNGGSRIIYPERFGLWNDRNVYVEGDVRFEVTHDERHPFIVNADNIDVRVLGTHFSVRAYRDEATITTTLEEGSVMVSDGQRKVILKPNEQAVYNKDSRLFGKVTMSSTGRVWNFNDLDFDHKPLRYIMTTIGHRYGVKFDVEEGIDINKAYTINFDSTECLDDVLKVLSMLENDDIKFELTGHKVLIFKKRKEAPQRK